MSELPKNYDPGAVEAELFERWLKAGYFERGAAGFADPNKPPYTIVIPPPNITGVLHMGHALNNTLQDILIRRARMQGRPTRWIVGTDHAGIATQNRVEQKLAAEGLTRYDVGREGFVEQCWEWRAKYGSTIIEQLKGIGASCDYSQEVFTMDENYVQAIRKVFVDWYYKKLIYRGYRIINWCPRCTTALADDEVQHTDEHGHLWYLRYPLVQPVGEVEYLVVATTRPETMLGDSGVAVNPADERYQALLEAGAQIRLPLMNRVIPLVGDDYVDPAFGTGAVKVTPAHDPNDFEIGQRHDLEQINILTEAAVVNEQGGRFAGLSREEAREAVVAAMSELGLLDHVDEHEHAVGHCYRCDTTIEPWASEQWFVSMRQLAAPAIEAVRNGRVKFNPQRWQNVYFQWMEKIRDWCISRQLWWGHRIPVFYCDSCGWVGASEKDLTHCTKCGARLRQDEDVLDTWFSSQLWPFATYGWPTLPGQGAELASYYPTQVLSTARDIIFLWVARMIMSSLYFQEGEVPFQDVIIHPTILDKHGNIMSKSRGNGIDPMELVSTYGADAMRFGLAIQVTGSQDVKFDAEKLSVYRSFLTKVFNAARFIQLKLDDYEPELGEKGVAPEATAGDGRVQPELEEKGVTPEATAGDGRVQPTAGDGRVQPEPRTVADRWILSRLARLAQEMNADEARYDFGGQARALYEFFWNEFCDWYIELSKTQLLDGPAARRATQKNLIFVLDNALRLLHPMMPFITEQIWLELPHGDSRPSLVVAEWPTLESLSQYFDESAERAIGLLTSVVTAVRSTRARYKIAGREALQIAVKTTGSDPDGDAQIIAQEMAQIEAICNVRGLEVGPAATKPPAAIATVGSGLEVYIVLDDLLDFTAEAAHLQKTLQEKLAELQKYTKKLANEGFLAKADPAVIAQTQENADTLNAEIAQIEAQIKSLQGA